MLWDLLGNTAEFELLNGVEIMNQLAMTELAFYFMLDVSVSICICMILDWRNYGKV